MVPPTTTPLRPKSTKAIEYVVSGLEISSVLATQALRMQFRNKMNQRINKAGWKARWAAKFWIHAPRRYKLHGTWTDLRSLGQSKVIRRTSFPLLLVPVVARILYHTPDPIRIGPFIFTLDLPWLWSVLFFSALFFLIASAIFAAYCPKIISQYESFTDFEAQGGGSVALRRLAVDTLEFLPQKGNPLKNLERRNRINICFRIEKFLLEYALDAEESIQKFRRSLRHSDYDPQRKKIPLDGSGAEFIALQQAKFNPHKILDAFNALQQYADGAREYARVFCRFLYDLGFLLLAFAGMINCWYVIRYVISAWWLQD